MSVTDFMPIADDDDDNPLTPPDSIHEIHRVVTCRSGEVELRCDFQPRHDYARVIPDFRPVCAPIPAAARSRCRAAARP